MYFSRQLEGLLPGVLEKRTIPLNMERLFPMIPVQDPDAERFVKRAFDYTGQAVDGRIDDAMSDVPMINGNMSEEYKRLWRHKVGWQILDRELRVARKLGTDIDTRFVAAAVRELYKRENDVLTNGNTKTGTTGLFTAGLIGTTALGSGVAWDNGAVTATDIYDDLEQMVRFIEEQTSTAYSEPVTIVLPVKAWNIANGFNMGLGTDTTVLQYFLRNWGVMVASIEKAREFDSQKEALVYIRNADYMGHMRVPIRQVGPVHNDLTERLVTHYEIASSGMVVFDSLTQRRFTGILT
jgi:hypothetical protein